MHGTRRGGAMGCAGGPVVALARLRGPSARRGATRVVRGCAFATVRQWECVVQGASPHWQVATGYDYMAPELVFDGAHGT